MKQRFNGQVYRIENEEGYVDGWYFKDNRLIYHGPFENADAAAQAYDRTILEGNR